MEGQLWMQATLQNETGFGNEMHLRAFFDTGCTGELHAALGLWFVLRRWCCIDEKLGFYGCGLHAANPSSSRAPPMNVL